MPAIALIYRQELNALPPGPGTSLISSVNDVDLLYLLPPVKSGLALPPPPPPPPPVLTPMLCLSVYSTCNQMATCLFPFLLCFHFPSYMYICIRKVGCYSVSFSGTSQYSMQCFLLYMYMSVSTWSGFGTAITLFHAHVCVHVCLFCTWIYALAVRRIRSVH